MNVPHRETLVPAATSVEKVGLVVDSSRDLIVADVREEVVQRLHNEESGCVETFEVLEIHHVAEMRSRLAEAPLGVP